MATAPTTGDTAETGSNSAELRADDERANNERADDERANNERADDERADDAADRRRRRGWRAWLPGRTGTPIRAGGPRIWPGLRLVRKDAPTRMRRRWRRIRLIDVLRVLGLARRAVPRPVTGPRAYPQWWQRVLALLVLMAVVVGIGFVLAALVGLMVVVAGFLLEQAIS